MFIFPASWETKIKPIITNNKHRIKNEEVKQALNNFIIWILFRYLLFVIRYSLFVIRYSILKKYQYYLPT